MRLTIHCQLGIPSWIESFLKKSQVDWLKIMDPGLDYPLPQLPDLKLLVRFWRHAEWEQERVWRGMAGATEWLEAHREQIAKRPWLKRANVYLEVLNEPHPMANRSFRSCLDLFMATVVRQLWLEHGVRVCGHNWSVGWPDIGHAPDFALSLTTLRAYGGLLGLHEYGWPTMTSGDGFWTLRHRKTIAELRQADIDVPPIAITECGLDSGLVGPGHRGWRAVRDDPDWYASELLWYEKELSSEVVCAAVFTATPAAEWLTFEVTEALAERLARANPKEDPEEERRTEVRIFSLDGAEQDEAWLRSHYGSVTISGTGQYHVAELSEAEGASVLAVTVLDKASRPQADVPVAFHWPDAPVAPGAGGLGRAAQGKTKETGRAEFALGRGAYYDPERQVGPHSVWPWGQPGPVVGGLGMLMNTEHRHLNVTFQEIEEAPPSDPPPPPSPPVIGFPLHDLRDSLAWSPNATPWQSRSLANVRQVVVHHTASEPSTGQLVIDYIRAVNNYHISERGWPRIGYHYVIGVKGVIWHCNRLEDITYHSGKEEVNAKSVGIALIGDLTRREPTEAQKQALKWLCQQLGKPAVGHKEVVQTDCPGEWWAAAKDWVNDWLDQTSGPDLVRLRSILEEIKRLAEEGLAELDGRGG